MSALNELRIPRDELHKRLGGGIPKGSLVLIDGEHGAGKSVLMQRFAYGLLENGNTITFISSQMSTKDFINQMYSLNFQILAYLPKRSLLFFPIYPLITGTGEGEHFLKKLMETKSLYNSDVLMIDTLSSIVSHTIDKDKAGDLVAFFKRVTGTGKTIIVSIDAAELTGDILDLLRASAHIYITMRQKTIGDKIKHSIVINKYQGAQEQYTTTTNFRVVPKIGFVIEISSVA